MAFRLAVYDYVHVLTLFTIYTPSYPLCLILADWLYTVVTIE